MLYSRVINATVDINDYLCIPFLPVVVLVYAGDPALGTFYPIPHPLLSRYIQHATCNSTNLSRDIVHARFQVKVKGKDLIKLIVEIKYFEVKALCDHLPVLSDKTSALKCR